MPDVDDTLSFRDVPDFDGYRISQAGRIQSDWDRYGNGKGRTGTWMDMKTNTKDDGYVQVRMKRNDGKSKLMKLHCLVLMAWVGPCPPGKEGCHEDGNKSSNQISNLYWGTRTENKADEKRAGRHSHGERHGMSKLKESDIPEIRSLYASGWTQREIAVKYDVTRAGISGVITGRLWSHV